MRLTRRSAAPRPGPPSPSRTVCPRTALRAHTKSERERERERERDGQTDGQSNRDRDTGRDTDTDIDIDAVRDSSPEPEPESSLNEISEPSSEDIGPNERDRDQRARGPERQSAKAPDTELQTEERESRPQVDNRSTEQTGCGAKKHGDRPPGRLHPTRAGACQPMDRTPAQQCRQHAAQPPAGTSTVDTLDSGHPHRAVGLPASCL